MDIKEKFVIGSLIFNPVRGETGCFLFYRVVSENIDISVYPHSDSTWGATASVSRLECYINNAISEEEAVIKVIKKIHKLSLDCLKESEELLKLINTNNLINIDNNDDRRSKILDELKVKSSEELFQIAVRAGIYTTDGYLTEAYCCSEEYNYP